MTGTNFRRILDMVQDVVSSFTIGPDATRVAFVSFSTSVKKQFHLNVYDTKDRLLTKVGNIR